LKDHIVVFQLQKNATCKIYWFYGRIKVIISVYKSNYKSKSFIEGKILGKAHECWLSAVGVIAVFNKDNSHVINPSLDNNYCPD
jgi:hypothetical protein